MKLIVLAILIAGVSACATPKAAMPGEVADKTVTDTKKEEERRQYLENVKRNLSSVAASERGGIGP